MHLLVKVANFKITSNFIGLHYIKGGINFKFIQDFDIISLDHHLLIVFSLTAYQFITRVIMYLPILHS